MYYIILGICDGSLYLSITNEIIFLCDGQIIFDGAPCLIPHRLEDMGYPVPKFTTPVDYLMKIIDRDEIKIQYEQIYEEESLIDPIMIEKLYKDRIKILMAYETDTNYLSKKSLLSANQINFNLSYENVNSEDEKDPSNNSLVKSLLRGKLRKGETLLDYESRTMNQKRNICSQIWLLTWLNMYNYFRKPMTYVMVISQIVLGNFLMVLIYNDLGDPEKDTIVAIQNRLGLCFVFCTSSFSSGLYSSLLIYLKKKKLFLKDKDARIYDELPYLISQFIYRIPLDIFVFALVVYIYYYFIGFSHYPHYLTNMLYTYFFIYFGTAFAGQAFSGILSTLGDKIEEVSTFTPFILGPVMLCSGFMANLKTATIPIQILAYLSPIRFAFQGVVLTEFQNKKDYIDSCNMILPCLEDPSKKCVYPVPEQAKNMCNPDKVTSFVQTLLATNIIFILGLISILLFIGYILFKVRSSKGKMKYKKNHKLNILYNPSKKNSLVPNQKILGGLDPLENIINKKIKESLEKDPPIKEEESVNTEDMNFPSEGELTVEN